MDMDEKEKQEQIESLCDALLVSMYRRFRVGRVGHSETHDELIEQLKIEIDKREIDLDNFNGATGFRKP